MVTIKQPPTYVNFAAEWWEEPYDRTLIKCDCDCGCERLCEKGVGLCDPCINNMVDDMTKDWDKKCENSKRGNEESSTLVSGFPSK